MGAEVDELPMEPCAQLSYPSLWVMEVLDSTAPILPPRIVRARRLGSLVRRSRGSTWSSSTRALDPRSLDRGACVYCSSDLRGCGGREAHETAPKALGRVQLALRDAVEGVVYRLRDGTFQITGLQSATLRTEDDPDQQALATSLIAGAYQARLVGGWQLERLTDDGWEEVPARLISPNPRGDYPARSSAMHL